MSNVSPSEGNIALVTGATGFVGSHLARRLVKEGWDVHIIIRVNSVIPEHLCDVELSAHVHDGSTECLISIVKEVRPTIVFHLASLFLAQHQPKDIGSLIRSNINFGNQLLEAIVVNNVRYLVNTGTSWQHYHSAEYCPVCLYAATKQAYEAILQFYTSAYDLSAITLKLFDTYGPDDPRKKLFSLLKESALTGSKISLSPGEQFIDLVYISDVVSAFIIAAGRLLKGTVSYMEDYAVSSGSAMKLKELVNVFCSEAGLALDIEWGGKPYRRREVMDPWNKGNRLPGWEPKVELVEGIRKIIVNTE